MIIAYLVRIVCERFGAIVVLFVFDCCFSRHIIKLKRNIISLYALNRLVTQNVDALHHKAQSLHMTELHGSAHRVVCLSCHHKILRSTMQEQIKALNPEWHAQSVVMAPDGDVSLTPQQVQGFKVMANQIIIVQFRSKSLIFFML